MTREKAYEISYQTLVAFMSVSWMEVKANLLGDMKPSPKAVRLCNALATELVKAYEAGVTAGKDKSGEET